MVASTAWKGRWSGRQSSLDARERREQVVVPVGTSPQACGANTRHQCKTNKSIGLNGGV